MNPSNQEMQLRKNCQLYAYLLVSQGKEVPEEIQDCIESYEYTLHCSEELSEAIEGLDSATFDRLMKNNESLESRELAYWWEMHQEANRLHKTLSSDT